MHIVGIDPGSERIGVAIGHTDVGVATPYEVWPRHGDIPVVRRLRDCVTEWEAERVVVGLPRSLDGTEGPSARSAREFVAELEHGVDVPFEFYDERFSTTTATESLRRGGVNSKRGRNVVDAVAAAVILQGWFDAHGESA